MAVVPMVKIEIAAPRSKREELVEELHRLGAVQVRSLPSLVDPSTLEPEVGLELDGYVPETRRLRLELSRVDFLIELVERFEEKPRGLLSSMVRPRVHFTLEDYLRVKGEIDLDEVYRKGEGLDARIRELEHRRSELEREREALLPWQDLDAAFEEIGSPATVTGRFIAIPPNRLDGWAEELERECPPSDWTEVSRSYDKVYIIAFVHRSHVEAFESIGQRWGVEDVLMKVERGTVRERIISLEKAMEENSAERERLVEEIRSLVPLKEKLLLLNDYLYNQLLKEEVKGDFLHTQRAFLVEGWVRKEEAEGVAESLRRLGEDVVVSFEEPEEGEVPPTALVNRRLLHPVESLVRLFGLPNYQETDPTWVMAPFFVFFFGMCMADVGYGVVLTLAFWFLLKKLDVSENVRRFLRLFMYGGMATILGGVLTRSYFGIFATEPERFPRFLQFKGTFDPLFNPLPYMGFCCALGLLHISLGTAIEMYDNARWNSPWRAFCEQGTTLVLWLGLAVTAVGGALKSDPALKAGLYIMAAGAAGIVFLSNVGAKSWLGKFFGGLYNLYNAFGGTIGDVASYLRLFALGLATMAIGDVINRMGSLFLGIPGLGIIFLFLILLGGHLFNVVINLLGAFVHPLRLQYVEFFGKFYEDGGAPFTPFGLTTRKTVIEGTRR
ncbi:MAG: V-type ATP synthase subunit I [Candidatus Geothermincolales bacterium]